MSKRSTRDAEAGSVPGSKHTWVRPTPFSVVFHAGGYTVAAKDAELRGALEQITAYVVAERNKRGLPAVADAVIGGCVDCPHEGLHPSRWDDVTGAINAVLTKFDRSEPTVDIPAPPGLEVFGEQTSPAGSQHRTSPETVDRGAQTGQAGGAGSDILSESAENLPAPQPPPAATTVPSPGRPRGQNRSGSTISRPGYGQETPAVKVDQGKGQQAEIVARTERELVHTIEEIIDRKLAAAEQRQEQRRQQEREEMERRFVQTLEAVIESKLAAGGFGSVTRRPLASPHNGSPGLAELPALEGKAAELFEQLKTVTGTDAGARQQAQEILNTYVGQPVTREFTLHFQHFLKEHGWRIKCLKRGCREPAAPVWQRDERRSTGGYLRCTHMDDDSGTSAKHGSMATFRAVTLVEYRDRRYS